MTSHNIDQQLQQATRQISCGSIDEGEAIALATLRQQPENAQARYVIGLAAYMRKRYHEAIESFTAASKLAPGNPMLFSNLGESLRRHKQPRQALLAFQRCLSLLPGFDMGLLGRANCLCDLNRNEEALNAFQRLLAAHPKFAPGYHYLGSHLAHLGRHRQALPVLRKAVALREGYSDALMTLAATLESLDQVDEAMDIFETLHAESPDNIPLLLNLGNIKKTQGKMQEANRHFDRVLELDPENLAAEYSISHSKDGRETTEIEALEKRFQEPGLGKDARRALHFTLGKYYDDKREYEQAFEHFKQGNDMDDRIEPYAASAFSQGIDRIIATFSESFFNKRYGMGAEGETPVFIVGMPRSGTSLTEQILSSHAQVYGAGELKNIGEILRMIQQRFRARAGFPECLQGLDPITACNLGERYLKETGDLSGPGKYARITDKMPGNTINLGLIALLLPRARIIHCKRSPMDSCFSGYSRNFSSVISYTRNLQDLGRHYRDYHRLMQHWKSVLPLQMLEVRYEDMVADHESSARRLVDFCGLEWEQACLDFQNTQRRVKTASTIQVRQPIYQSSVAKWRHYEKQLQPLFDALGDLGPRVENGMDIYS